MKANLFDTLKLELEEATYRVIGTQVLLLAKSQVIDYLRRKGIHSRRLTQVSSFLDTPTGTALLATAIGVALPYVPHFKKFKQSKSLAREFRVSGLTFLGNKLYDIAFGDIIEAIKSVSDNFPKIRISHIEQHNIPPVEDNLNNSKTIEFEEKQYSDKQAALYLPPRG